MVIHGMNPQSRYRLENLFAAATAHRSLLQFHATAKCRIAHNSGAAVADDFRSSAECIAIC